MPLNSPISSGKDCVGTPSGILLPPPSSLMSCPTTPYSILEGVSCTCTYAQAKSIAIGMPMEVRQYCSAVYYRYLPYSVT